MIDKVRAALKDFSMLQGGKEITVALSGGADSMALLYALLRLQDEFSLKISAAHLNHSIRGAEADRDEEFVINCCRALKVPLVTDKRDVIGFAKENSCSTELAARKVRYEFLSETAKGVIATAHTASDNLETVLMNLTRGTGLKGLCGIPPVRDRFIRPLIYVTREEVELFCKENDIPFVVDSSNLADDYTRNHLRHNVVPQLKKINPSLENTLINTVSNLREDSIFLSSTAQLCFAQLLKGESLLTENFSELPKAVATRVLILFCEKMGVTSPTAAHIEALYEAVLKNEGTVVLPGKTEFFLKQGSLCVKNIYTDKKPTFSVKTIKMSLNDAKTTQKVNNLLLKEAIDCDKIIGDMVVRTRLPGDKITLNTRNVTKTLKKLFNEEGIPEIRRDALPVITDDMGVVWVLGFGPDKRVAVNKNTTNVFLIEYKEN